MKRAAVVALAVAFIGAGATLAFVALRGPAPAATIDDRTREVASTLRCPVCMDLSVADSPSLVARQMRHTIERRLRDGQTPEDVTTFFVSRYGESVLLTPKAKGIDLLAWIIPGLLGMAGLALLILALRRWAGPDTAPTAPAVTGADRALLDRELRTVDPEAT